MDRLIVIDKDLVAKENVRYKGSIICEGDIMVKGDLISDGSIKCKGSIICDGNLTCKWYLKCNGGITCTGTVTCKEDEESDKEPEPLLKVEVNEDEDLNSLMQKSLEIQALYEFPYATQRVKTEPVTVLVDDDHDDADITVLEKQSNSSRVTEESQGTQLPTELQINEQQISEHHNRTVGSEQQNLNEWLKKQISHETYEQNINAENFKQYEIGGEKEKEICSDLQEVRHDHISRPDISSNVPEPQHGPSTMSEQQHGSSTMSEQIESNKDSMTHSYTKRSKRRRSKRIAKIKEQPLRDRNSYQKLLCKTCGMRCLSNDSLQEHLKIHFGGKKSSKTASSKAKKRLAVKLEKIHILPYKCSRCSSSFNTYKRLKKHFRKHVGFRFLCLYCSETFRRQKTLNDHAVLCHAEEDARFKKFEEKNRDSCNSLSDPEISFNISEQKCDPSVFKDGDEPQPNSDTVSDKPVAEGSEQPDSVSVLQHWNDRELSEQDVNTGVSESERNCKANSSANDINVDNTKPQRKSRGLERVACETCGQRFYYKGSLQKHVQRHEEEKKIVFKKKVKVDPETALEELYTR